MRVMQGTVCAPSKIKFGATFFLLVNNKKLHHLIITGTAIVISLYVGFNQYQQIMYSSSDKKKEDILDLKIK